MARGDRVEKPLDWVGSSKKDFLAFSEAAKDETGNALGLAPFGGKHPKAKPWKGAGVFEVVDDHYGVPSAGSLRRGSRKWSTYCTPSRRSRGRASRPPRRTLIW